MQNLRRRFLTSVDDTHSSRDSGLEPKSMGQSDLSFGMAPCVPLTREASRGIKSMDMRNPIFFWSKRRAAFAVGKGISGSTNNSAGS